MTTGSHWWPLKLDHLAVRVVDRDAAAASVSQEYGWLQLQRTGRLTLMGASAQGGKLTLLQAEPGENYSPVPAAMQIGGSSDRGITGVTLVSADPLHHAGALAGPWGGESQADGDCAAVAIGPSQLVFAAPGHMPEGMHATEWDWCVGVDHVGILVTRLPTEDEALRFAPRPIEFIDAEHSRALFYTAASGYRLELIEHKPEFARLGAS